MGKLLRGLVAMVVLSAGAAVAAPCNDGFGAHPATPVVAQPAQYGFGVSVAPPPPGGHWVTRETREWLPGYWTIQYSNHHHGQRVFIPGHFHLVAKRVFVDRGPVYGATVAPPPPARFG